MTLDPTWLHWPQTQALVRAFAEAKAELRFVGGAVRDAVLGRAVQDVDAATPATPDRVVALLERAGIKAVPTGIEHGTVTAAVDGKPFEITTLRKDTSCDGRHAEVAFTDDWKEDAARRDFTMNALYLSPQGEVFDYFGGEEDAKSGRVRFIGNAAQRVSEDYLRILRFFRFYAHYGHGAPDVDALEVCAKQAAEIDTLSGERIQHELFKLLAAKGCARTLALMQSGDVIGHALGFSPQDCTAITRLEAIETLCSALGLIPRLAALLLPQQEEESLTILSARLKLSNAVEKSIRTIVVHHKSIPHSLDAAAQKHWIRTLGVENFKIVVTFNWARYETTIDAAHPYRAMLQLADTWKIPTFPVSGDDLLARGMKPGKELGEVLHKLEAQWEASDYTLTKADLLK